MKIVTILKQVPDAEARLRPAPEGVDLSGVSFVIDGMDEYGVEQALRIREGGTEAEVVALALGPARFEEAIRTALAMGADRAIHIETDSRLDPISQARVLAKVIEQEGADLVMVGGKQADWDSSALGPAVAEALGWPHSDWTTGMELREGSLTTVHDADEGTERLEMPLPAVITTQQGLNEPRYPTLPNIMKAKRKELRKTSLEEVGGAEALVELVGESLESRERRNVMLDGDPTEAVRELVRRLRDEAKVLAK
ncbi:MAG TPA: electron transfer flavoprotein subunit beta/FixA family protein [Trueperaceae bacterium]